MTGKVLLCGAWDEGPGYPRTRALRDGLTAAGLEVRECRLPGGLGRGKQKLLRQPWRWPLQLWRWFWQRRAMKRKLREVLAAEQPELVMVPYPGHTVVRDVAAVANVPVVLDLFLSAYDTAVVDRELFGRDSLPARLLRAVDRRACAAADLVLLDTPEHAGHVAELLALPREHFDWWPVSDPDAPAAATPVALHDGPLRVLFFGTGVPLHGLDVLIAAAARSERVELTLIGGSDEDRICAVALLGPRLRLLPGFVDRAELQRELDRAELVAGVFSTRPKAGRVVPFKVMHALASGRQVVTADLPAVRRLCGDGLCYVPAGDAVALAARLQELARDKTPLRAAGAAARAIYEQRFATAPSALRLGEVLARAKGQR